MKEIVMPKSGATMEEGTLVNWLKADGDYVKTGDVVAEIETDKVTMELESPDEGYLKIVEAENTVVPVGGVIAYLNEEKE